MVLGSTAQVLFLCVGRLGGRWNISSPALPAAVTLPGQPLGWGKREHRQIPVSERPALPCLVWGCDRLSLWMSPGDGQADLWIPYQPC